jgi:phosphoribosylamine--glycine ligase
MERIAKNVRVPPTDFAAISDLVRSERIDYVVVGPEAPLSAGLVDHLKACGIPVVGPTQRAAQLESSKVFSKDFMSRHNVPTARYATYQDAKSAIAFLESSEAAFRSW